MNLDDLVLLRGWINHIEWAQLDSQLSEAGASSRKRIKDLRRPTADDVQEFRISPDNSIAFGLNIAAPADDEVDASTEVMGSRQTRPGEMDAYERVLSDAIAGDTTLFARENYVEEALRIVDPALKASTPVF